MNYASIAPIPSFPRRRGKGQFGVYLNKSHQLRNTKLTYFNEIVVLTPVFTDESSNHRSVTVFVCV